jgi:hypothetical protein
MRISFDRETDNTHKPMGASTSPVFSEIYLQYMEHTAFVDTLNQQKILGFR